MTAKIIMEAAGTLLLIYMLIHEQDLIAFEQNAAKKLRYAADHTIYRIWMTVLDVQAIRRACRRQNITAREFLRKLQNEVIL